MINGILHAESATVTGPCGISDSTDGAVVASTTARILLAEDNESLLGGLSAILASYGHQVSCATNSAAAADLLFGAPFDVVIADVGAPGTSGMDGMALLRLIREIEYNAPVILITGHPTVDTAVKALELDVLQYLVKPFDYKALQMSIQKALQMKMAARNERMAADRLVKLESHIGDNAGLEVKLEAALSDIYQVNPLDSAGLQQAVRRALTLHKTMKLNRVAMERIAEQESRVAHVIDMEIKLDSALESMWMAFQPIARRSNQTVLGYEALMRSNEPALPHPGAILAAAEQLGRLHDVGRRTRQLVAEALRATPDLTVFVNLSVQDLLDMSLYSASAPLSQVAKNVVLEITERASLETVDGLVDRLAQLRALGYRIALDDLGSGYAGLTSLLLLEPDFVKVDMALIRGVDASPTKQILVRSIIDLCQEMHMNLVAEGVETEAENATLIGMDCDLFQGYLYARPGRPFPTVSFAV